jgi:peptidoglycan/xylan/chitin deacetylase (PgdA/CDA1 family)
MSLTSTLKETGFRALGRVCRAASPGTGLGAGVDGLSLRKSPFPLLVGNGKPRFQILVYHRVLPDDDAFAMSPVSSSAFDAQMALLRKRFRVVSLDQLGAELDDGGPKPGTVCVTFDDGYRDNHDHALPILKKHGIPATIYLATGLIGTGESSWYDKVLAVFRETRAARLEYEPAGFRAVPMADARARSALAHRLLEWLKAFPPAERDAHIRDVAAALGCGADAGSKAMLDWDLVRSMHAQGVAFGAHTVNHPILSRVAPDEMGAEIAGSKAAIENSIQHPVRHFAYPNGKRGDYNETTIAHLKRQGFVSAVTTNAGVNGPDQSRFEWLRRQPWENSVDSLYFRMLLERLTA